MEFFEAVQRRRSVRRYTTKAVPAEVMAKAFEAAQLAPNSSNLQTWEFIWVRSVEKKKLLVEACLSQGTAKTAQELVVVVSRRDNWKRNTRHLLAELEKLGSPTIESQRNYYGKVIPFAYGLRWLTPVKWLFVRVVTWFRPMMNGPVTTRDLDEISIKSAALASQNFMLAIASQGFDTCPMEGFDERRVKKLLGAKCSARIVMVISVGERDAKGIWGTQFRFPKDWFLKEI